MLTIGRSEEVGITIVDGDLIHGISGDPESNHITPFGKGVFFVSWTIAFFCWRASNGEPPKFKGFIDYELKSGAKGTCLASLVGFSFDAMDRCTFWRPSLDSECNLVKSIDEELDENSIATKGRESMTFMGSEYNVNIDDLELYISRGGEGHKLLMDILDKGISNIKLCREEVNIIKGILSDISKCKADYDQNEISNNLEFSFISDFSENPFVKIENVLFETNNVIVFTAIIDGKLRELTSQKVNIIIREIDHNEKAKQARLDHMLKTFTSGDMKNLEALVYNNSHIIKRGLQSLIDAGYEIHLTCDPSS